MLPMMIAVVMLTLALVWLMMNTYYKKYIFDRRTRNAIRDIMDDIDGALVIATIILIISLIIEILGA